MNAISSSLGGLNAAAARLATASSRIANASNPPQPNPVTGMSLTSNGIRLDEEVISSKLAALSYTANAKVIQVQLKTEKELLNILA